MDDIVIFLTAEQARDGAVLPVQVDGRLVKCRIPSGVRNGTRIRLPGAGPAGDRLAEVRVVGGPAVPDGGRTDSGTGRDRPGRLESSGLVAFAGGPVVALVGALIAVFSAGWRTGGILTVLAGVTAAVVGWYVICRGDAEAWAAPAGVCLLMLVWGTGLQFALPSLAVLATVLQILPSAGVAMVVITAYGRRRGTSAVPRSRARTAVAVAASAVVPVIIIGAVAAILHGRPGFALRYGTPVTVQLFGTCRTLIEYGPGRQSDADTSCAPVSWQAHGVTHDGTVHLNSRELPSPVPGLFYPRRIPARAVGDDAFTRGTNPGRIWPGVALGLLPGRPIFGAGLAVEIALLVALRRSGRPRPMIFKVTREAAGRSTPRRPRDESEQAPGREQVIRSDRLQITVDDAGFEVRARRRSPAGDVWAERLRMSWSQVRSIGFATDRFDPVVALYVWPVSGGRHHVADSGHLPAGEWERLAAAIARSTGGRLTLDLSRRTDPRAPSPDW